MKKKVAIVIGTRPEMIKMAPVMRALKKRGIPYLFIHSNQHYSVDMDANILHNLGISHADINLQVGSGNHGAQTGKIMEKVEDVLLKYKPSMVLVHGDTNTTLAAALAAVKLHIPVGHVEAGLRSFDYSMPEEINRMLVDRISDILFAPTSTARSYARKEGIQKNRIVISGNTVVDALQQHKEIAEKKSTIMHNLRLSHNNFILLTAHRPENVDTKSQLQRLILLVDRMAKLLKKQVIFPTHPRTRLNLENYHIKIPKTINMIGPVDYFDMLMLLDHSALVMTDSGGIQEEAYILHRPLLTIRTSTERPETLSANKVVALDIKLAEKGWRFFQSKKAVWKNTLGNGNAAEKIVEVVWQKLHQN